MADNKNWIRSFQVTQPVRHKKGFTVYKVVSKVFQRNFPEGMTTMTVWKRYSDFKKLHMDLHLIHSQLHLKGKFPPFPKATVFGRFDYEVVEARRKSALALLEFAALHSLLFTSKVFVKFFENGYDVVDLKDPDLPEDVNGQSFENCLIPERLWGEPLKDDRDGSTSASSFDDSCTTPGRVNDADADSMISSAVLSCTSEILPTEGVDSEISQPTNSSATLVQPEIGTNISSLIPESLLQKTKSDEQTRIESERTASIFSKVSTEMPLPDAVTSSTLSPPPTPRDTALSSSPSQRPISVSASWTSLSSLENTILSPPLQKSESSRDLLEDEASSSGIVTNVKKPSGAGFFDFLPIFSKQKQTAAKSLENKLLNDSLSASYICEAAGHFTVAQQYESNRHYQKAFRSYKEGIRILLVGAKDDKDLKRKRLVKSKLDRYLNRAEYLYENYLTLNPNSTSAEDFNQRRSVSPIPAFNPEKLWQSALQGDSSLMHLENIKPSPVSELKEFKLVRIISKQVYLVVNIKFPLKPKCCAIKILLKSSDPIYPSKPTIIPSSVPFMVKFFQWFETEFSYILVMQYAGGGQLNDFVKLYQTKPAATIIPQTYDTRICDDPGGHTGAPTNEEATTAAQEDQEEQAKLTDEMESVLDALAQLGSTKENCESYSRLFEEYTETVHPDDRTQLATYSKAKHPANLSCEYIVPEKETCKTESRLPFEELQFQTNNLVEEKSTKEFDISFEANTLKGEDASEGNNATMKLIESSKVLLQTVNRTLAAVKSKSAENINRLDVDPELMFSISNENNNSRMDKKGGIACKNSKCGSKTTELEEEDEGIQSACEGSDADKELEVENSSSQPFDPSISTAKALDDLFLQSSTSPGASSAPAFVDSGEELDDDLPPQRMVPECCIKIWAAEIVLALEKLHSCNLSFGDLEMKNVLLGENGHILLSLGSQWSGVDQSPEMPSRKYEEFLAPEIRNSLGSPKWKIHPSSDFWSLGVILFELITGQKLGAVHREGFHHPDTVVRIPDKNLVGDLISHNGRTLLTELLQYTPSLRLGFYGAAEVKSHPFFDGFDWESALEAADTINE